MDTPETLKLEPFPALAWVDEFWEGWAPVPPAWRKLRVEPSRGLRGDRNSFGVSVYRHAHLAPSRAQVAAFQAFLDDEDLVVRVLGAVLKDYRSKRKRWLSVKPDLDMPVITRVSELMRMTELDTVYVHDTQHRGRAYLGIALRARWDQEHGAGVMLHRKRVVSVGGHDEALLQWIAEKDAKSRRRKP